MACLEPIKCYKIRDDLKVFVQLHFDINPCAINCISFTGCWLSNSGEKVPLKSTCLEELQIPCRKCKACRLDYARQWSLKGMLEYESFNETGCFITLTYDDKHLPSYNLEDCSKDFQDFMKRLRKKFKGIHSVITPDGEVTYPIRYLHCGEYGTKNGRPHHHAILFNFVFPDEKFRRISDSGYPVYYSKELLKLWSERVWTGEYEEVVKIYNGKVRKYKKKVFNYIPKGKVEIGRVSYKSISYVARYVTKKVYGDEAFEHYGDNKPEYITMSRNPGIGKYWFDKYYTDMYTYDKFKLRGINEQYAYFKPPKSFDKYFERLYPDVFKEIKEYRKEMAIAFAKDPLEQKRENEARAFKLEHSYNALIRPLNEAHDFTDDERKMIDNDSRICI